MSHHPDTIDRPDPTRRAVGHAWGPTPEAYAERQRRARRRRAALVRWLLGHPPIGSRPAEPLPLVLDVGTAFVLAPDARHVRIVPKPAEHVPVPVTDAVRPLPACLEQYRGEQDPIAAYGVVAPLVHRHRATEPCAPTCPPIDGQPEGHLFVPAEVEWEELAPAGGRRRWLHVGDALGELPQPAEPTVDLLDPGPGSCAGDPDCAYLHGPTL